MCELFGFSSGKSCELNAYLKEFFSHSVRHPHGWGLACVEGEEVSIEKESLEASKSNYLKERLSMPVSGEKVLAHIRYATIGNVEYQNCHPYVQRDGGGRRWILIHNGTIFDYPALEKYQKVQKGTSDSERILLYFMDKMNEREHLLGRAATAEERFLLLDRLISDMSRGNKVNLILYDGELLYIHTNFKDSLHYLQKEGAVLVATTPLSEEAWQDVPFTQLLAFRDEKLVFEGTVHGNEYFETEENLKYLYQIYSDL